MKEKIFGKLFENKISKILLFTLSMKTETTTQPANSSPAKMAFDMYPSISSGKQQDPVREVVMKYIDYFLPE